MFSLMFLDAASYAHITGLINGIEPLNGSNYVSWKEKLEINLALLDLDYALNNDAPKEPQQDAENYEALRKEYNDKKALWEPSNRKCLMIIKSSIIESIRGAIPDSNSAKEYLSKVKDQFKGSSKIYASTLIKRLVEEKYNPTGSLREHIMKKCHMAAKLKSLKMEISDGFLVYFIMSSLPPEFSPFTINYNAMKIKWSIDEMIAMCVQENERIKAERIEHIGQFQTSQKRQYKRFVNEYMKPKKPQFKNKGQCSKKIQQNKPQQKPQQNTNTCWK